VGATEAINDAQPGQALTMIAAQTASALSAQATSVIMLDESGERLVFQAAVGQASPGLVGKTFSSNLGIAGHVVRSGKVAVINDATRDTRFYRGIDRKTQFQTRGVVCAPLRREGRIIGVVEAINKKDGAFDSSDASLLRVFANLAAAGAGPSGPALDNDCRFVLQGDVWELSYRDGEIETGHYSRSAGRGFTYFHELMSRPGTPVSATDLVRTTSPAPTADARRIDTSSSQEAFDRTALRAVYERIEELKAQIETAQRTGDRTEQSVFENELEQLRTQLQSDIRFQGRVRSLTSESTDRKAREAVRIALRRARAQIARAMPRLAEHLEASVAVDRFDFVYRPAGNVDWEL
jgi:putative methionine-R-sulfoxide reductase with GAF domain